MSATYILATDSPELLREWWVVVPPGRQVITLEEWGQSAILPAGVPVVVVLDASAAHRFPRSLEKHPLVLVGGNDTPHSQSGLYGQAKAVLTYEESRQRLGQLLPLLEEIAEFGSALKLQSERIRRIESPASSAARDLSGTDQQFVWDFLEGALENSASRESLLDEFRRAARRLMKISQVLFFLKDSGGFKADRAEFDCALNDPLISYWSGHPAPLDGVNWPEAPEPALEMLVRQRLGQWGSRLLVPIHDNGRLQGFIAFGVKDNGHAYQSVDHEQAIILAKLLRQFLAQTGKSTRAPSRSKSPANKAQAFNLHIFAPEDLPPGHIPPAVSKLINDVRESGEVCRLIPSVGQAFNARAGLMPDTDLVWLYWEDASSEIHDRALRERTERLALLRDLALTLNHELGNALVSLAALRHNPGAETNSPVLLAAIKKDIARLETINRHLSSLHTFSDVHAEATDLRQLLQEVGRVSGLPVKTGSMAVLLEVAPKLVEFALESIVESVIENRPQNGSRGLSLELWSVGAGEAVSALITLRGQGLALEGILPEPQAGSIPSHGRIGVFIAKEIIRLHAGEITAGPSGDEILITFRRW